MSIIASASKNIQFHQWPGGDFQQSYVPKSHTGYIQSISWGKDGSWVVVVPDSGPTEIISIKDNVKLLQTIQDIYRPSCASFHTTTKKLVGIGTLCGQVMIYDIKGKHIKKRFPRISSKICSLHYNSNDSHIAATCNNGEILLLSNLAATISTIYKVPKSSAISSANFHRSKRNLFTAGSDIGSVAVWDINSNRMTCNMQIHQAPVTSIRFSPLRDDIVVTGGLDRKFTFYDLSIMKPVIDVEVSNAVTSLDFSSCGVFLGIGFQNGKIAVYDTRRSFSQPLSLFEAHHGSGTRHLLFQRVGLTASQNDSVFDITIMEPVEDGRNRTANIQSVSDAVGQHTPKRLQEHDSFLLAMGLDGNDQTPPIKNESDEIAQEPDSFLLAVGLDENNQAVSTKNESAVEIKFGNSSSKANILQQHSSVQKRSSLQKSNHTKASSTPKYLDIDMPNPVESPIFCGNCTYSLGGPSHSNKSNVPTENLHATIKEIVQQEVRNIIREEIKSQTEALESSIKMDLTDMHGKVRREFLDLHLSMVKQFISIENLLNQHDINENIVETNN